MNTASSPVRRGHAALRRGRASAPGQVYHLTAVTCGRRAYFAGFDVACAAVRGFLQPTALADARLLAWVLMPDHAHWLLQLQHEPLGSVVGRMKSASGVHANRVLARTGPVWEPAFHDHALRRDEDLRSVARYIIANPVRAGLVDRPGDYPFWDCIWMQEPAASPPPLL